MKTKKHSLSQQSSREAYFRPSYVVLLKYPIIYDESKDSSWHKLLRSNYRCKINLMLKKPKPKCDTSHLEECEIFNVLLEKPSQYYP